MNYVIQNLDTGKYYSQAGSIDDWTDNEEQAAVYDREEARTEATYQRNHNDIACIATPTLSDDRG